MSTGRPEYSPSPPPPLGARALVLIVACVEPIEKEPVTACQARARKAALEVKLGVNGYSQGSGGPVAQMGKLHVHYVKIECNLE